MNAQPLYDEEPRRGLLTRLREGIFGADEPEDPTEIASAPRPVAEHGRSSATLRIHAAQRGHVSVRLNAQAFDDAQVAADGLKNGEHQVVNLERASPQMAERIIDFLNGVVYALEGRVERVGDRVYMFVPANVQVEVDRAGATQTRRASHADEHTPDR